MTTLEYYVPTEAEQRLIDALRSGKFNQEWGALERNGGNCCLGVACRVSAVELGISTNCRLAETRFNQELYYLPDEVKDELGWEHRTGMLLIRDRYGRVPNLGALNDDGFTFLQLADIIAAGLVQRIDDGGLDYV